MEPIESAPLHSPDGLSALLNDFAELVASKLRDRLGSDFSRKAGGVQPRLLDIEQASLYLGRSPNAVYRMVGQGLLPCVRADRRVFLDLRDLDQWIDLNKCTN